MLLSNLIVDEMNVCKMGVCTSEVWEIEM